MSSDQIPEDVNMFSFLVNFSFTSAQNSAGGSAN